MRVSDASDTLELNARTLTTYDASHVRKLLLLYHGNTTSSLNECRKFSCDLITIVRTDHVDRFHCKETIVLSGTIQESRSVESRTKCYDFIFFLLLVLLLNDLNTIIIIIF